jgi:cobalt-zinc-cadmium efflux system protein
VPPGIDLSAVRAAIVAVDGVASSHELHVWATASDEVTLTVHVVLTPDTDAETVRIAVAQRLDRDFHIHHATIQTERIPCADATHA